jgi:hypothetical protein
MRRNMDAADATTTADMPEEPDAARAASNGTEPKQWTQRPYRDYVKKLRRANAAARTKAKCAEVLQQKVLDATIRIATTGILADPTDLTPSEHLLDNEGYPDVFEPVTAHNANEQVKRSSNTE